MLAISTPLYSCDGADEDDMTCKTGTRVLKNIEKILDQAKQSSLATIQQLLSQDHIFKLLSVGCEGLSLQPRALQIQRQHRPVGTGQAQKTHNPTMPANDQEYDSLKDLLDMGFGREVAMSALKRFAGDKMAAADYVLNSGEHDDTGTRYSCALSEFAAAPSGVHTKHPLCALGEPNMCLSLVCHRHGGSRKQNHHR